MQFQLKSLRGPKNRTHNVAQTEANSTSAREAARAAPRAREAKRGSRVCLAPASELQIGKRKQPLKNKRVKVDGPQVLDLNGQKGQGDTSQQRGLNLWPEGRSKEGTCTLANLWLVRSSLHISSVRSHRFAARQLALCVRCPMRKQMDNNRNQETNNHKLDRLASS